MFLYIAEYIKYTFSAFKNTNEYSVRMVAGRCNSSSSIQFLRIINPGQTVMGDTSLTIVSSRVIDFLFSFACKIY